MSQTRLEQLEHPKPDDVGAWVRCRVTGARGQVWSYGKTKAWRVVADGEIYHECLAVHLMPIDAPAPPPAVAEPGQEGLW